MGVLLSKIYERYVRNTSNYNLYKHIVAENIKKYSEFLQHNGHFQYVFQMRCKLNVFFNIVTQIMLS